MRFAVEQRTTTVRLYAIDKYSPAEVLAVERDRLTGLMGLRKPQVRLLIRRHLPFGAIRAAINLKRALLTHCGSRALILQASVRSAASPTAVKMRGGDDFKAAIEEQKRRARDEYERKRSGSWQGKEELVSPTIPDMEPLGMFSGIPGLGNGRPTVETTVETLGSRQASENQSSKDVERDLKSPISPTDGDKPRQSSMTTGYAGLVSARKRKHDGSSSNVAETASSRRKSVVSKDGGEGTSGRPFAPPKKLPRGARPAYDEMLVSS